MVNEKNSAEAGQQQIVNFSSKLLVSKQLNQLTVEEFIMFWMELHCCKGSVSHFGDTYGSIFDTKDINNLRVKHILPTQTGMPV